MIHHLVMLTFKPGVTDEQVAELERMLDGLPDKILEIQAFDFGRDTVRSERSCDFGLASVFANLDTLAHYQQHPEHLKVLAHIRRISAGIRAVDFESRPHPHFDPPAPWDGL